MIERYDRSLDALSGKERVRLALDHQEADRVPIWELGFHNAIARKIMGREIYLPTGGGRTLRAVLQANAQGEEARRQVIRRIVDDTMTCYDYMGFDMVRFRPTDFLTPFAFGSGNWSPNALLDVKIEQPDPDTWVLTHADGFWSRHMYINASETLADTDDSIKQGGVDELRRYVEALEAQPIDLTIAPMQDALNGIRQAVEHPLADNIFVLGWGDVCYPGSTAHVTEFLMAMVQQPELVKRYMEVTTAGVVQLVRAQAELGVDGITGGNDWAFKAGPMFSAKHMRQLIAPYLKEIVDETHRCGLKYIKHGDGDLRKHMPILVDEVGIDGLHSIEPGANMDIAAFKRQYGDRLALLGNLDCDLLVRGRPEEIEAGVIELMQQIAPGGGYVFSTSNTVLMDAPLGNLNTMLSAARKYGKYSSGI